MSDQQSVTMEAALTRLQEIMKARPGVSLAPLLPFLFKLNGKPYDISKGHFPFESQFRYNGQMPQRRIMKCGRQVAKSTSGAAKQILLGAIRPYTNILTVTPLFEQIRKFSNNYVRPFLVESSIKSHLMLTGRDNSVLQRTLATGSNLFYGCTSGGADRLRGIGGVAYLIGDEIQDHDLDAIEVVRSCMDASTLRLEEFAGTPKSTDNIIEVLWQDSSQGEWLIQCDEPCCRKLNLCSVQGELLKMIGEKTLVCAHCGKPVNSRSGHWHHLFPERRLIFEGNHVPQVILPMHYEDPRKWFNIRMRMLKSKTLFYNENLGESIDTGLRLVSKGELEAAAILEPKTPKTFQNVDYAHSSLGVDWGGKGKEAGVEGDFISNTALALVGRKPSGVFEVPWLRVLPYEADHVAEARLVKEAFEQSKVDRLAHDYTGAGNVRESILTAGGFPKGKITPFTYNVMAPSKPLVFYEPPLGRGTRASYTLDKPRSLLLTCLLIKCGLLRLPRYGQFSREINHFLALIEETTEGPRGRQLLIKKAPKVADDIAHAINFGIMDICHRSGEWPSQLGTVMNSAEFVESWTPDDLH